MNEEILKAIQGVGEQVKAVSDKTESIEKRIGALEVAREAQAANTAANAAAAGSAPVAKTEEKPVETPAVETPAKAEPTDIEKQVLEMLGSITKDVKGVSDKQDAFEKRLAKIESTPVASHAAGDEGLSKGNTDEAELVKSYQALDSPTRSRVNRAHLGFRMIPELTAKR